MLVPPRPVASGVGAPCNASRRRAPFALRPSCALLRSDTTKGAAPAAPPPPLAAAEPPPRRAAASGAARSVALAQLRTANALLRQLAPAVRTDSRVPALVKAATAEMRSPAARRLYRELLFTAVRHWAWVEPLLERDDAAAATAVARLARDTAEVSSLRAAARLAPLSVDAAVKALQPLAPPGVALCSAEELAIPGWLRSAAPAGSLPPASVALSRPPMYIRLSAESHSARVISELLACGVSSADPLPGLPCCLRLRFARGEADVTGTAAFDDGLFEVQDAGSQALLVCVLGSAAAPPAASQQPPPAGPVWLDLCAGGGGKTLQLASLLGPTGRVVATDVRPPALAALRSRAQRCGLPVGRGKRLDVSPSSSPAQLLAAATAPGGTLYDGVLVRFSRLFLSLSLSLSLPASHASRPG